MKNTGITRKVDELGRIVIPKEIRNVLFIKEGTPMEIAIAEDASIVLRKNNVMETIGDLAQKYCNVLYEILDNPILITDDSKILYSVGLSKKLYHNKELSNELIDIILNSKSYTASDEYKTTLLPIIKNEAVGFTGQIIIPIMIDGKTIGLIISLSNQNNLNNSDVKIMQAVSKLISMHLSNT